MEELKLLMVDLTTPNWLFIKTKLATLPIARDKSILPTVTQILNRNVTLTNIFYDNGDANFPLNDVYQGGQRFKFLKMHQAAIGFPCSMEETTFFGQMEITSLKGFIKYAIGFGFNLPLKVIQQSGHSIYWISKDKWKWLGPKDEMLVFESEKMLRFDCTDARIVYQMFVTEEISMKEPAAVEASSVDGRLKFEAVLIYWRNLGVPMLYDLVSLAIIDLQFKIKTSKFLKGFQYDVEMNIDWSSVKSFDDILNALIGLNGKLPQNLQGKFPCVVQEYLKLIGNIEDKFILRAGTKEDNGITPLGLFAAEDLTLQTKVPFELVPFNFDYIDPATSWFKDGSSNDFVLLGIGRYVNHWRDYNAVIRTNSIQLTKGLKKGSQVLTDYGPTYFEGMAQWESLPKLSPLKPTVQLSRGKITSGRVPGTFMDVIEVVSTIKAAKNILVITGAGVSSHAIPPFRGIGSDWCMEKFPNSSFAEVNESWLSIYELAKTNNPSQCHRFLDRLCCEKKVLNLSQNVDEFEKKLPLLGHSTLYMHGVASKSSCTSCFKSQQLTPELIAQLKENDYILHCNLCNQNNARHKRTNGQLRPDYVLHNDGRGKLSESEMTRINGFEYDVLLVIGTSLSPVIKGMGTLVSQFLNDGKCSIYITLKPNTDHKFDLVIDYDCNLFAAYASLLMGYPVDGGANSVMADDVEFQIQEIKKYQSLFKTLVNPAVK